MTIEEFIEANRQEIDKHIRYQLPTAQIDDDERENWILNDEYLYNWACRCDVEDI